MNRTFCDRCGTEITNKSPVPCDISNINGDIHDIGVVTFRTVTKIDVAYDYTKFKHKEPEVYSVDLCNGCKRELSMWLSNRSTIKLVKRDI